VVTNHQTSQFVSASFRDDFVCSLPGDTSRDRGSRLVTRACYSFVDPTPVANPKLLAWSKDLATTLGFDDPKDADEVAAVLTGNRLLSGMRPYSARYGGHQFGHWAGQLGDGRAITLGEIHDPVARSWEVQLKGAGPTPYSRRADGRAVLRSSLREFLCSEAMHHLGIPTTRALALCLTGDGVLRDMFYDGNPEEEPGAITTRVSPSFLRFGNFQILEDSSESDLLRQLADYTISRFFPEFSGLERPLAYARWFEAICRLTASLMVEWQRVGFVHGVMNTDNMSILGLTIDYGPYGWLEGYDLTWTPNITDAQGRRYCYGRQPQIAYWNLERFGQSIISLFESVDSGSDALAAGLSVYEETFKSGYRSMLARKLGIAELRDRSDLELAQGFLDLLGEVETDMTIAFRCLMDLDISAPDVTQLMPAIYQPDDLTLSRRQMWADWLGRYSVRVANDAVNNLSPVDRRSRMATANPNFVLRNYLAQEAIDEIMSSGSAGRLDTLMKILQRPYDDWLDYPDFLKKRPEWARHRPGCSALSCSS
jgi:uncharacterized protein YdiU (UPF0061 family)